MPESAQAAVDWRDYYNRRFAAGYAEAWPAGRYVRIARLIDGMGLPGNGRALDFGCGNGSFSDLLQTVLPGWQVTGADLSPVAVDNARRRFPRPAFTTVETLGRDGARFDLVFSHHVLEHVPDLAATWRLLADLTSPRARLLHVMPCGNAGSVEHQLAVLRRDGIDRGREGRFYLDDEPHVRRLTDAGLQAAADAAGFRVRRAYYAQQFWSQLWPYAQKSPAELVALTDWRQATRPAAAASLLAYRALFLAVSLASWPTLHRWRLGPRADRTIGDHVRHAAALSLAPISTPVTRFLRRMDEREWTRRQDDPRGAEMYMIFERNP
jgi:SAM-dependent methyltransferase